MISIAIKLEKLSNAADIINNCDHNMADIYKAIMGLYSQTAAALGLTETDTEPKPPEKPQVDKLNRRAWLYLVDAMSWCQAVATDLADYDDSMGLIDSEGNMVDMAKIWTPTHDLLMDENFIKHINGNWNRLEKQVNQMLKNFKDMYQKE